MRRALLASLALIASPAIAGPAAAPFAVAETGRGFGKLQDAVSSIGSGAGTIMIAPGVYRDCAVQTGGDITFKAVQPDTAIFDGVVCEDKAVLVLRGTRSRVDGLVFRHLSVSDGNGAGIRAEMGDLTVVNSMFLDSQEGILGGPPNGQQVVIDRSTFAGLGQCDQSVNCAHSVYLANKGSVTITHSRFERGNGGHYVKLRVPNVSITDNSFDDSRGSKTNYMIDLSEGGTGLLARNAFVEGRNKENWTGMIVVAAEARTYPSAGLRIEDNDAALASGTDQHPAFVVNYSRDRLAIGTNKLAAGITAYAQR